MPFIQELKRYLTVPSEILVMDDNSPDRTGEVARRAFADDPNCELDHRLITAAERNPDKWGKRTVGTRIPSISEDQARTEYPDYFLILSWHFLDEFVERERAYPESGGKFIVPLSQVQILSQRKAVPVGEGGG